MGKKCEPIVPVHCRYCFYCYVCLDIHAQIEMFIRIANGSMITISSKLLRSKRKMQRKKVFFRHPKRIPLCFFLHLINALRYISIEWLDVYLFSRDFNLIASLNWRFTWLSFYLYGLISAWVKLKMLTKCHCLGSHMKTSGFLRTKFFACCKNRNQSSILNDIILFIACQQWNKLKHEQHLAIYSSHKNQNWNR